MQGVRGLRQAFNETVGPAGFNCTMALLDYERKHDSEFQILRFRGKDATGADFDIRSEDLRPSSDLGVACRETAQRLLDQRKPTQ